MESRVPMPMWTIPIDHRYHLSDLVETRESRNSLVGKYVVAKFDLLPSTVVGQYSGRVYKYGEYADFLTQSKTDDLYMFVYPVMSQGAYTFGRAIITPKSQNGSGVDPAFAGSFGAFFNEPDVTSEPNCNLVYDFTKGRPQIIYVTTRGVKAHEQLTICYGEVYDRKYASGCREGTIARFLLPGRTRLVTVTDMTPSEKRKYRMGLAGADAATDHDALVVPHNNAERLRLGAHMLESGNHMAVNDNATFSPKRARMYKSYMPAHLFPWANNFTESKQRVKVPDGLEDTNMSRIKEAVWLADDPEFVHEPEARYLRTLMHDKASRLESGKRLADAVMVSARSTRRASEATRDVVSPP